MDAAPFVQDELQRGAEAWMEAEVLPSGTISL
jgi:hypothetical protein